MAGPSVFAGNFVKFLKGKLDFFGIASILTGTQDPTSVATEAPKGSLMMRQTPGSDGLVYKKNDDGSTTNWEAVASAANSSSAYADYYDINWTALPDYAAIIDGSPILSGQTVYFSNLSLNNGKIYKASVSLTESWSQQFSFAPFIVFCLHSYGDRIVFCGTSDGSVRRSLDGGDNWSTVLSFSANGIFVLDEKNVWAVGASGNIRYSSDGGTTWVSQTSGVATVLNNVFFINNLVGWAVGNTNTVIKTVNGGLTWSAQTATGNFTKVSFTDVNNGYLFASGSTTLYKTIDGGATWTATPASLPVSGNEFYALTNLNVYVTGSDNSVYVTTNGGTSWSALPTSVGFPIYSIYVKDSNNIYVSITSASSVYKTADGGTVWSLAYNNGVVGGYGGLHFASPYKGWVYGGAYTVRPVGSLEFSTTWTATKAFRNAQESAANGEIADIGLGTKYGGHYVYKTSSGQYHVNDTRRFFDGNNGLNFLEVSAIRTAALANNTTAQLLSVPFGGYQNFILDYSIVRGTTRETGMLMVSASETTVSVAPFFAGIGSTGVTFSGALTDGNIVVSYTTTNTGTSGTMKYSMRRWGN